MIMIGIEIILIITTQIIIMNINYTGADYSCNYNYRDDYDYNYS